MSEVWNKIQANRLGASQQYQQRLSVPKTSQELIEQDIRNEEYYREREHLKTLENTALACVLEVLNDIKTHDPHITSAKQSLIRKKEGNGLSSIHNSEMFNVAYTTELHWGNFNDGIEKLIIVRIGCADYEPPPLGPVGTNFRRAIAVYDARYESDIRFPPDLRYYVGRNDTLQLTSSSNMPEPTGSDMFPSIGTVERGGYFGQYGYQIREFAAYFPKEKDIGVPFVDWFAKGLESALKNPIIKDHRPHLPLPPEPKLSAEEWNLRYGVGGPNTETGCS